MQVDSVPPHNLAAGFELLGTPKHGRLSLTSPLGTRLAEVEWSEDGAVWRTAAETRHFVSMAQLTEQLVGTPLPLSALFDWLQSRPTKTQGWEADLQDMPRGRLRALRSLPEPAAQLRIVLDQ